MSSEPAPATRRPRPLLPGPRLFTFFEQRVDPFPADAPPPPARLLPFVLHLSRPLLPWLGLTALASTLIAVVELVVVQALGGLVDWLAAADPDTLFADHGTTLALLAALVVIGLPALVLLQSLVMHQTIFGNYPMLARWLAHRHVLGQSLAFFQDELAGRVSQKVMQTALAVRETVMKVIDVGAFVAVYFTGALVLVGATDLRLTAPLLLWLAVYVFIIVRFVPRLRTVSMAQADARAQMTGRVVDAYANVQTVKLFAHAGRELDHAQEAMGDFLGTVDRQMRLATQLTVLLHTANACLLAGIAALAIYGWQAGTTSLGAVAVAIALVLRIRAMSEWVLWQVAGLLEQIGTVEDGMRTIAQPVAVEDAVPARTLDVPQGEIRFENVRFAYHRAGTVIDDLSLVVRPGEKVGLVGRSGAGKSTLVGLLLRFHDLDGGRIRIDGQDIAEVTQDSLRHNIGVVTQDTSLMHRSIRDNVAYGRPEATDAEVWAALARAQALEFVRDLVDHKGRSGLDAVVGERGVKLSGGQRQRIAIARVLLKDAPILVLDEATSALDSEVEAAIQEGLDALMTGKTVVAIAHRLSTIAAMDRLVVMDEGRIVESGTHDELLALGGRYAGLWRRQSLGFLVCDGVPAAAAD